MDKKTKDLFFGLVFSEISGNPFVHSGEPLDDAVVDILIDFATRHDIVILIADALLCNKLILSEKKAGEVEKIYVWAVIRYNKIVKSFEKIKELLCENKIEYIPLKGNAIREMYPEPWMRSCCDVDILVKGEDLTRAVSLVTASGEFKISDKSNHDVSLLSENGVGIELHHTLINKGIIKGTEKVLSNIWKHAVKCENGYEYTLDDTMFYYYQVTHMAKHVKLTGGCGIRPFIDLWLLNQKGRTAECEELMKKSNLLSFCNMSTDLADYWFGKKEPSKVLLSYEKLIITAELGKDSRYAMNIKRAQRKAYFWNKCWAGYEDLCRIFPRLEKHPILLPFYEIVRWLRWLNPRKARKNLHEIKTMVEPLSDTQSEFNEMWQALGFVNMK